jgi:uncharacterized protein (DUF1778 family)
MAKLHELERTTFQLEASASEAESMLESVREVLAAQRSELQRLRLTPESSTVSSATANDILEFITMDDELMADLDAVVNMDEAALLDAMAAADERRGQASGLEAAAERALEVVYRSLIDMMRVGESSSVGDVVGGRADVYRVLTAAVDTVVATLRPDPPVDELAIGAR